MRIMCTPLSQRPEGSTLILFDVDGTLAVPAQLAEPEIVQMLDELRQRYAVGIVGAGDFKKQERQLGGADLSARLDFVFSENGVHAFRDGVQIHCKSIVEFLGEARWEQFQSGLKELLSAEAAETERLLQLASLSAVLADRSTFLECRECTVNVCPIGRVPTLSKEERAAFEKLDTEAGLRRRIVERLTSDYGPETEYQLTFSIGGQIGIDVCPCGWDKTFCLRFVSPEEFPTVHFFGDKTYKGGGDYEIFESPRTMGHTVTDAADTLQQVQALFFAGK